MNDTPVPRPTPEERARAICCNTDKPITHPPSLLAIARAARIVGDRDLERSARQLLLDDWGIEITFKRERHSATIDAEAACEQIATAIRAAVDEETAALRADLAKAQDTIRQLADRVEAQSEALTRRAEGGATCS